MVLAGVHVGCLELFAHGNIRGIMDLKGKTVGLPALDFGEYLFMASIASYVGLDPLTEINWVDPAPEVNPMNLFIEGKSTRTSRARLSPMSFARATCRACRPRRLPSTTPGRSISAAC